MAPLKLIALLLTLHTGFSAYVAPGHDGHRQVLGKEGSTSDLKLLTDEIASIEEDLMQLNNKISNSKAGVIRRVVGRTGYLPIPRFSTVKQIRSSSPSVRTTSKNIEKDEVKVSESLTSLYLFNLSQQNTKIQGLVKLLPQFLYMNLKKERFNPLVAITKKISGFGKKEIKPESYVKLSPGYSFMTCATTLPKRRGDTRLFSFRNRP
eukprot:CAMPEP_0204621898 /NCGR_PEP_ID=MMETSP0717-20131115/7563_1 /ASSEMBLY_ACC=CAM_ASM_000666 /TAXON_ID=230516 /ORGANISM="Chaetoceros curvisetus" /LENGTH=206 /DNA_ID=CAMNT_0051636453 /DNA_START=55 /DNA_END=675 /DNA_ORIENTATION=+